MEIYFHHSDSSLDRPDESSRKKTKISFLPIIFIPFAITTNTNVAIYSIFTTKNRFFSSFSLNHDCVCALRFVRVY